jgi:hypothetical protein
MIGTVHYFFTQKRTLWLWFWICNTPLLKDIVIMVPDLQLSPAEGHCDYGSGSATLLRWRTLWIWLRIRSTLPLKDIVIMVQDPQHSPAEGHCDYGSGSAALSRWRTLWIWIRIRNTPPLILFQSISMSNPVLHI